MFFFFFVFDKKSCYEEVRFEGDDQDVTETQHRGIETRLDLSLPPLSHLFSISNYDKTRIPRFNFPQFSRCGKLGVINRLS